jgi:hypothetical protein
MWSNYDWVYCCCRPSVTTICGRIFIRLSLLSSVSKHNMRSYYDWVLCLLTDDNNDNPIIIRPHIVFTDGRQQRQPVHNTTTYYVYWRMTTTINPIIIRPHCMFTDTTTTTTQSCRLSVNIICGRIVIGLSLSSVIKRNIRSYYDWVVIVVVRQ